MSAVIANSASSSSPSSSLSSSSSPTVLPSSNSTATTAPPSLSSSVPNTPPSGCSEASPQPPSSASAAAAAALEALSISGDKQQEEEEEKGGTEKKKKKEREGEDEAEGDREEGEADGEESVLEAGVNEPKGEGPSTKKKEIQEVRVLVSSICVGAIIGKEGNNVKRVRSESQCFVSILKTEHRLVQDRIMILKGSVPQVSEAARLICELLVQANIHREQQSALAVAAVQNPHLLHHHPPQDPHHVATVAAQQAAALASGETSTTTSLRLLVHRSAVGAIIGKGGAVIKETQQQTQARIQVANDPLPNSTEKTVTVSGTPKAIQAAVKRIVAQLADNPLRPGARSFPYIPGQAPVSAPGFSYYPPPSSSSSSSSASSFYPHPSSSIYPPAFGAAAAAAATVTTTQKIAIPSVCAGLVIGKGGQVIRDLRVQSGTNISIADSDEGTPNERIVTISGSAMGIQTAVWLIRGLVESYTPPQTQPQSQSPAQPQSQSES